MGSCTVISVLFSRLSGKLVTFLHLKTKFQCGGWNAAYYSKTKCHFKVRMHETLGLFTLTDKRV